MKNLQGIIFSLILTLLSASVSHSYENLVLQGTVDEISQEIVTALKAKEFTKSEEILKNLLASRRKSPHGTRMLEEVYKKLSEFEDMAILDQWCLARTQSHFPLVIRGNYYTRKANELRGNSYARQISEDTWKNIKELHAKAQVDYEAAYAINPDDAECSAGMVAISLLRGYPSDIMEKWFKRSVEADPAWMKSYQGKLYYLAPMWYGSKEQMESFVKDCFENSPEGSVVYTIPLLSFSIYYDIEYFRGDYMAMSRQLASDQEAMITDALSRFHKDCPHSPRPDYYQGLFYQMGASNEDALVYFKKAEAKDSQYIDAWIGEAFTELVLERPDKAEVALDEILKIDPRSAFALMNLGYVRMLRYNDYPGGMELFKKGVQASNSVPRKTDGLYRLAQFLKKKEKYREAIDCFSQALKMDPLYTKALFGRANAQKEMGDFDGAMEDMLIVQNMGGEDAESAKALAEEILSARNKKDFQAQSEQVIPPPSSSVETAAHPAIPSPPTHQDDTAKTTDKSREITTADIRQTIDESPTAVSDNLNLQERFDSCEALYFRRLKDQAIDCFSSILLEAPEYAKTYFMLGQIAEKLEADMKKAGNYYTQAISKDQSNGEYMLRLGQVLYMERNFSQAIQVLTKLIELSPNNGEAFYQRGLCFDALGQKEQAIEDMQKASMYAGKAEAAEYLNRNVVFEPPPPPKVDKEQELITQVDQNINMQRFDQAEKQLQEVLKLNPKNDYAIFKLGVIYKFRDQDDKRALAQYGKAIELNPKYKDYLLSRAAIYEYLEEYQKAADDYTSALALSPKEGKLYGERANCMMKLGEYKKASEDLKKASELSPGSRDRYNHMIAEISAKGGIPLEEGSASPAILLERGKRYAEQKEFDLAKRDIQQAITLDPHFAKAYYEMGRMHAEKMRLLDEAIPWFDKAIELDKSSRDFFFHRGLIYFEKRDFKTARTDFTSALELQKDDTQVYYYRGVCNKELGQKDQAVEDLLKARKDPGWVQAVDGLLNSMM